MRRIILVKIGLFFQEIYFLTEFPGIDSNLLLPRVLTGGKFAHGGESRDLNDKVHRILCRYSDKTSKRTYHTFLNTQQIFKKQSAQTSYLFGANVHIKVTPQYAVVLHTSPNKYCFQYFNFARFSAENCYTL